MTNIPALLLQFYIGNAPAVYHLNFMDQLIFCMDFLLPDSFRHNVQITSFIFGRVAKARTYIWEKPPKKRVFLIEWLYHTIEFLYWKPMCDSDKILLR